MYSSSRERSSGISLSCSSSFRSSKPSNSSLVSGFCTPVGPFRNSASAACISSSVTGSSSSSRTRSGILLCADSLTSSACCAEICAMISSISAASGSSGTNSSAAISRSSSSSVSSVTSDCCTSGDFSSSGILIPCSLAAARMVSSRLNSCSFSGSSSAFLSLATSAAISSMLPKIPDASGIPAALLAFSGSTLIIDFGILSSGIRIVAEKSGLPSSLRGTPEVSFGSSTESSSTISETLSTNSFSVAFSASASSAS